MKRTTAILVLMAAPVLAQLTPEQREFDFRLLAAAFAKNYAPVQWKQQALQYDLYNLGPWLQRVRAAQSDPEFLEVCTEYVTSLRDTHSSFRFPSLFSATLGFSVDYYDGKLLFELIQRNRLPVDRFPFLVGDELVSMDGKPADQLVEELSRFVSAANPQSRRRQAAARVGSRSQQVMPRAHEIGESATIVVRRANGGEETYTIPWLKSGEPVTIAGKLPSPRTAAGVGAARADGSLEDDIVPPWFAPLKELRNEQVDASELLNYGSIFPVWAMPAGFRQRLGQFDFFWSGTYEAEGLRIGFLRIPNFVPSSTAAALRQFEEEIRFFEQNTDGLIIDVMRNNGGDACYNEEIQRRLIPYPFRGMGREIRATQRWVIQFSQALEIARLQRAEPWIIELLEARLQEIRTTFRENGGRTGPIPICAESLIRQPAAVVYTKPLMVLMDGFSTSAADAFPAVLQDARRGPMFGMRTNGAGGTTGGFITGAYSEAQISLTAAMHYRREPIVTPEYPTANYVENIGVRPDIEYDYMTRENLMSAGRPFVQAFTRAMVEHIRQSRGQ